MNYSLEDIAQICGAKLSGENLRVTSVAIDSRTPGHGPRTLFVAIRTQVRDGHDFIDRMYSQGVRAFMVERTPDSSRYPEAGFVVVSNTVEALQNLAAHHRRGFSGVVAAITGSNGKTVVKEWIAQLSPEDVRLFRSPGSYNSQIGVPLSVLMISPDDDVALIEAGISKRGEMEVLERIIRPDIGIFTNIGTAHQENFDSVEQKVSEKALLFRDCKKIIFDSGFPVVEQVLRRTCPSAELIDSSLITDVYARMPDKAAGQNAAQSVAFWDETRPGLHDVLLGRLSDLQPVAMRMELLEGVNDSIIINDTYNSDLNSLGISLDYLCRVGTGRGKVLVLADILENGMSDSQLYASVARMVSDAGVERLIAIGSRIGACAGMFECPVLCYDTAQEYLRNMVWGHIASRAVLIKGNRSSGCEMISHALEKRSHTTVLEVDLDAMTENLKIYRSRLKPTTRLTAMVKAASYGHGTFEIASTLSRQGVDYLAVAFADEGVTLRREGINMPIVVLNADAGSFDAMVQNNLEPEIYGFTSLADFINAVKRHGLSHYPIHIKIDSGMHRLGFMEQDADKLVRALCDNARHVHAATVFSHLAAADTPDQDAFTLSQIEYFDRVCDIIDTGIGYRPLRHIAATSGMERFPQAQKDMCRLGIGLYGVGLPGVKQIATLKTRIVRVVSLDAGQTVGYGRAGVISRKSRIATVPIGYADGLNRRLGEGNWSMSVRGGMAPIIGRICMDSCMIDVTDIKDAGEGDEVTVFSPQSGNTIEDMAQKLGTIPYEIMTGISSRVKRVYIKE